MLFRRLRGVVLDDPVEPLRDYWVSVTVALREPTLVEDPDPGESDHVVGYVRLLGVRAQPLNVRSMIDSSVDDGAIVWDRTQWNPVKLTDLDRTVRKRIVPIEAAGVWYQSGRILFPSWTDEEEGTSSVSTPN